MSGDLEEKEEKKREKKEKSVHVNVSIPYAGKFGGGRLANAFALS